MIVENFTILLVLHSNLQLLEGKRAFGKGLISSATLINSTYLLKCSKLTTIWIDEFIATQKRHQVPGPGDSLSAKQRLFVGE